MANKPKLKEEVKKIQVTFNKSQLELIDSLRGIFGDSRAEVVRHIVTDWLFNKRDKK